MLLIHPLVLGQGRRLFDDRGPGDHFELVDSVVTPKGVIITTYQREADRLRPDQWGGLAMTAVETRPAIGQRVHLPVARGFTDQGLKFRLTGRARVLMCPVPIPTTSTAACWAGVPGLRTANCHLGLGRGSGSSGDPVGQALLWIRAATPSKIRLRPNCKSS